MNPTNTKWQGLLDANPDLRRWYTNHHRSSSGTARSYLACLGRFLERHNLTPAGLLALEGRTRDNLVFDTVQAMAEEDCSGSYIKHHYQAIVSWLAWNTQRLGRSVKIPGLGRTRTLENAHIPTQDELHSTFNAANPRQRVAIALVAHSGVRPGVLGNDQGLDGLLLRDLTEARLEGQELVFDAIPTRVDVRAELSKTRKPYTTFLGPEACSYIQAMLRERVAAGETLTPRSPLLSPRNVDKPHMTSESVSNLIRDPMRAVGLQEPPYIWRSYFNNRCLTAESEGLGRDFKVYMMGHGGGLEVLYGLGKKIPPDTLDKMRRGYQAALKYLETSQPIQMEDPALGIVALLLKAVGHSPDDVAALKLAQKSPDEIVELLKSSFAAIKPPINQRTVTAAELNGFLALGWRFLGALPDGQVVVQLG